MANERLRSCMATAGHSHETVAVHVGVDPKTVERWVTKDRLPHRTHRWKTASLLGRDEAYLWPAVLDDKRTQSASDAEVVKLYAHRGLVPTEAWRSLVHDAVDSLDVLAYAALFLPDGNPDMAHNLAAKGADGVQVRVLLGDPNCEAVARRGEEEGIGEGMASRIRIALSYLAPVIGMPNVELRLHDTTLYNSIFRADETMLVNNHVYGSGAGYNPVVHLQRVPGGRLFDTYQRSFDKVWVGAKPATEAPPAAPANLPRG